MKKKRSRPRRTLKQKLNRTIRLLREKNLHLRVQLALTTRERDTARRQVAEIRSTNIQNAQAHRATEIAMLRQNHELQVAQAMLYGKEPHMELAAAAKEVPAVRLPAFKPVEQPKEISP